MKKMKMILYNNQLINGVSYRIKKLNLNLNK